MRFQKKYSIFNLKTKGIVAKYIKVVAKKLLPLKSAACILGQTIETRKWTAKLQLAEYAVKLSYHQAKSRDCQ